MDGSNLQRLTSKEAEAADLRGDWGSSPDYHGAPFHKNHCKNGGWQECTSPSFADQGSCIDHVNQG